MMASKDVDKTYQIVRERYARFGVDTESALERLGRCALSLHVWQGDDLAGFERRAEMAPDSGLLVTGNHPGRARTVDELRADLEKALSLIPGRHRVNLHAMYGEFGSSPVDRNEIEPFHFKGWVEWARERGLKLDFNATCFNHPLAASGWTLSHRDKEVRKFWVEHVKCSRRISVALGRELRGASLHNLWIPDGSKDAPLDRWTHRALLKESLDEIFETEYSPMQMKDSLESKLFGIGSESYVVGSHEFYLGYAQAKGKMVCLDLGHFHPTESVADKISAILQIHQELLLHLIRPVRWDSDHVVILNEDVLGVLQEVVRGQALERVHLALDYFDASLNRVGAWVIGARAVLKALLIALLEPADRIRDAEIRGDLFGRLALFEEAKALPWGSVWDVFCLRAEVPAGPDWMDEIRLYQENVLGRRGGS
ncbi:MAG: L-rhamnose isomerase [Candidatus Aminicenantes bacterium]|nr:L-rhamnose isomerase [Candidatus Aminicenantes bacterium]